jgi:hypothetical protein
MSIPTILRTPLGALLVWAALLPVHALAQSGARAGGPGRAGGPPLSAELPVVARFDRNDDGRLDASERAAARAWLETYRPGGSVGGSGSGKLAPTSRGPTIRPDMVESFRGRPFFDPDALRTIFIELEAPEWEQELAAFYDTDVDVPATVTIDGRRYDGVGVRFRGSTSFLGVPDGWKRSLNLSFDLVDEDQRVEGYRTLNLLNGHNDPTFVRAALYSEIAREYIAAPKVGFVRVVINGESWGLFATAEQFNKDFLRDHFGETDGARWKVPGVQSGRAGLEYLGDDAALYRPFYEIRSRDDPQSWRNLIELTRVLSETPPERLESALAPLLDVDAALRFLALEVVFVNPDGYWARASDFDLWQDPGGRFHVIPHDFNEGFGAETFGTNDGPRLDPLVGLDARRPLRAKLLAAPALRTRYLAYVHEIADRWLSPSVFGPMTARWRARTEAEVRADTRKLYGMEAYEAGFAALERFAAERRAWLAAFR